MGDFCPQITLQLFILQVSFQSKQNIKKFKITLSYAC